LDFGYQFALEGVRAAGEGDFEMATLLLEKAAGVSTDHSNYWTVLGNISIAKRQLEEAGGHFSRALQEDNDDLLARLGLISIDLQRAGKCPGGKSTPEQRIAEFGRIDHVDSLETIFLTAVVRADHAMVSELLKNTEGAARWDVTKHGAICHLIGRYFPFGLGLHAVVSRLPHLTINNLFVALFDVQRGDLSEWAAIQSPKVAIVNSQPKNVFNDYPIFDAIASAGHNVAYFMGQVATSIELTRSGIGLAGTYLLSGDNLADCNVDLIFSTSPQAASLETRAAKVLIPHDIAGHPRGSTLDAQSMAPIPGYDLFDYFLTTNDRMEKDLALFVVENE
jgi:tetratricopeptide (TPR) repeat protein